MEQTTPSPERRNLLLKQLPERDREAIVAHLEDVTLDRNDVCIEPDVPMTHVYFLDGGLGSTVMPDASHGTAELGAQGYEGMIGVPAVLGADQT